MSTSVTTIPIDGAVATRDRVRLLLDAKSQDFVSLLACDEDGLRRFKMQALTAIVKNPDLLQCNANSVVFAVAQCAELGLDLSPALGQAHLIPYKIKGVMTAQFMPGYRGLIKLAVQSSMVKTIEARVVYVGDAFEYEYGTTPFIRHVPSLTASHKNEGILCVYATGTLDSGEKIIEIMTLEDISNIRAHAKSQNIWVSDFGEMCRKSAVRRIIKYLPASADSKQREKLERAIEADNENFDYETPASDDPIKMPESTEQPAAKTSATEAVDAEHTDIPPVAAQPGEPVLLVKRIGQPKPTRSGGMMWSVELSSGPPMSTFKESCFRLLAAALQSGKPVKVTTKENGQYVNIEDVEYGGTWASFLTR